MSDNGKPGFFEKAGKRIRSSKWCNKIFGIEIEYWLPVFALAVGALLTFPLENSYNGFGCHLSKYFMPTSNSTGHFSQADALTFVVSGAVKKDNRSGSPDTSPEKGSDDVAPTSSRLKPAQPKSKTDGRGKQEQAVAPANPATLTVLPKDKIRGRAKITAGPVAEQGKSQSKAGEKKEETKNTAIVTNAQVDKQLCTNWWWIFTYLFEILLFAYVLAYAVRCTAKVVAKSMDVRVEDPKEFGKKIHTLILPLSRVEENDTGEHKYFIKDERKKIIEYFRENNTEYNEVIDKQFTVAANGDSSDELRKFKHFPWQQQFRVIHKVLLDRDDLKHIYIIPSTVYSGQCPDFIAMIAILLCNRGKSVFVDVSVGKQFYQQVKNGKCSRCDIASVDKTPDAYDIWITERDGGVDHNQPGNVKTAMEKVIDPILESNEAGKKMRKKDGDNASEIKYVAIDITGGQRTFGAMAAILSTREGICFTYVKDDNEVDFYNIDTIKLDFS